MNDDPLGIDYDLGSGQHLKAISNEPVSHYFVFKRKVAEIYHVIFTVEDGVITLHEKTIHFAGPKARQEKKHNVNPAEASLVIAEIRAHLEAKGWEVGSRT